MKRKVSYYELIEKNWWIKYSELVKIFWNPFDNSIMIERIYITPKELTISRNFYSFDIVYKYHYEDCKIQKGSYNLQYNELLEVVL